MSTPATSHQPPATSNGAATHTAHILGRGPVKLAPGEAARRVVPAPPEWMPPVGVCTMQAAGDGTFRPVLRLHANYVDVPEAAKHFNIARRTLIRLIVSEFIKGRKLTPGTWQVNVASLSEHLRKCEEDPEFWTPERRTQFNGSLGA